MAKQKLTDYSASSIDVNLGLDAVRNAPQIYISSPDSDGILHIAKEAIDNSIDEARQPAVKDKTVGIILDGPFIWVFDYGRGIPVERHSKTKISTLTTIMTTLSAGGKMRSDKSAAYQKTAGIHGVGISVTNALSSKMEVWTHRDNKWYYQKFLVGKPMAQTIEPTVLAKIAWPKLPHLPRKLTQPTCGTIIRFVPDYELFDKGSRLPQRKLRELLQLSAYLHPQVKFLLANEGKLREYHQPKGLTAYVAKIIADGKLNHVGKPFEYHDDLVDIAAVWSTAVDENTRSFVNGSPTSEGGSHVQGLNAVIADAMAPFKGKRMKYRAEDLRAGMICAFNIKVNKPRFTAGAQTKNKLGMPEVTDQVKRALLGPFGKYFASNKTMTRDILRRATEQHKATEEFKLSKKAAADMRTNKAGKIMMPEGLAAALSNKPEICELFLVEGDSAGGCFCERTKIALINGKAKSLKMLVKDAERGIVNYGYAHSNKTGIHVVPIDQPRLVKYADKLTEVTLDNGEKIRCTRDHRWKLRDGSYRRADKLTAGTSLMPLYQRLQADDKKIAYNDRRMVWHPSKSGTGNYKGRWEFVFHMVARDNAQLAAKMIRLRQHGVKINTHHKDEDIANDHPDNLRVLAEVRHLVRHGQQTRFTSENSSGENNSGHILWYNDKSYRRRTAKRLNKAQQDYWSDADNRKRQAKRAAEQMANPAMRKQISESVKTWWTPERRQMQAERARQQMLARHAANNHKVVSVRNITLKKPVPVYDASISKYHNYALAAGVFVHNTAKEARDRNTQAVLPLFGKMLNVVRATDSKIAANKPVRDVLQAVGYDPTKSDPFSKLQYGKVIFLADADPDGEHINLLLSGIFQKILRPLIEQGRVYVVDAPLFTTQVGAKRFYAASRQLLEKQLPTNANRAHITRIKGWGEINPPELREVAFDPQTRKLKRLMPIKNRRLQRFLNVLGSDTEFRKNLLGVGKSVAVK